MSDKMPTTDWFGLRRDYEAGVIPIASLCARYSIERKDLDKAVAKYGWERQVIDNDIRDSANMFASSGSAVPGFDSPELKGIAIITQAEILAIHRKDVARLRAISSTLVDRLGHILEGQEVEGPCMGSRESPADLLEKLSRVMVRTVQIERQAFNLEAFDPDTNREKETEEVSKLWGAINDALKEKAL